MSRAGRLLLYGLVTVLVLAAVPAAHAAPTAAVGPVTSGMKALGSHSENRVDHSILVGDPGPEPAPRLFVTSAGDVTVTLDAPTTSLTASVAGAPVAVSQSGPLTYTIDVPEGQALPALVSVRIVSVNGDWDGDATWGVELAAPPVALFSTPATAPVAGSLLAALYGPHGGPTRIG